MQVLGHRGFRGAVGQLQLTRKGRRFPLQADERKPLKAEIQLTENDAGPSDSVGRQPPGYPIGQCE